MYNDIVLNKFVHSNINCNKLEIVKKLKIVKNRNKLYNLYNDLVHSNKYKNSTVFTIYK